MARNTEVMILHTLTERSEDYWLTVAKIWQRRAKTVNTSQWLSLDWDALLLLLRLFTYLVTYLLINSLVLYKEVAYWQIVLLIVVDGGIRSGRNSRIERCRAYVWGQHSANNRHWGRNNQFVLHRIRSATFYHSVPISHISLTAFMPLSFIWIWHNHVCRK